MKKKKFKKWLKQSEYFLKEGLYDYNHIKKEFDMLLETGRITNKKWATQKFNHVFIEKWAHICLDDIDHFDIE